MKKRKFLIAYVIIFALGFLQSCDLIEECGKCVKVTEDADGNIIPTNATALPFCGDQLAEKESKPPETVGGISTYWNCY